MRRGTVVALGLVALLMLPAIVAASGHLSQTSGTVSLVSNNGPAVEVDSISPLNTQTPFPNSNSVLVESSNNKANFTSSSRTNLTIDSSGLTGAKLRITDLDISGSDLDINAANTTGLSETVTLGSGGTDSVEINRSYAVDSGGDAFSYSGGLDIVLPGLPSSTTIGLVDTATDSVVAVETTDSSGVLSVSGLSGSRTIKLVSDSGGPTFSNEYPVGPQTQESGVSEFNGTVSDPDLDRSYETYTVEVSLNGQVVGTDTVSSDGEEFSVSTSQPPAGVNNWSFEATDELGNSVTESYQFSMPNSVNIFNESEPGSRIDNTSVEVRFFFERLAAGEADLIEQRTVSDGEVNLTGLPVDEPFIVVAEAGGFADRRIFVPSILEQRDIFLLPDSTESVDTIFELEDFTGSYESGSTVLFVQRELGTTNRYETVLGDFFGANGDFPATLAKDVRHRLVIQNIETGDRRVLGTYTPITSETETVRVDPQGTFEVEGVRPSVDITPSVGRVPEQTINFTIDPNGRSRDVSSYEVDVVEIDNGSRTVISSLSESSSSSRNLSIDVGSTSGERLAVETTISTVDGPTVERTVSFDVVREEAVGTSFIDALTNFGSLLPSGESDGILRFIGLSLAVLGTAAVASQNPISTEVVGIVALMFLTGTAVIGWTPYSLVFLAAVVVASLGFLRRRY